MAAGILLFNHKGELLIVKPNYKQGWSIPGGNVDHNESPRAATVRETKEEVGITVKKLRLVCLDYTRPRGIKTESLQFVFFGGALSTTQIAKIQLDTDELDAYMFVSTRRARALLGRGLRERLPYCLRAIKEGTNFYLES